METFEVVVDEAGRGELRLLVEGVQAGKMDILIRQDKLTVFHTEVDESHEGKGFAKLLLQELVAKARAENLKIKPLCPYVHAQFKRHPDEYADVWSKSL